MKNLLVVAVTVVLMHVGVGVAQANKTIENQFGATESERRESYINNGQAKLEKWQKHIDQLQGKAAAQPEQGKLEGQEQMVETRRAVVDESLKNLKTDFSEAKQHLTALKSVKSEDQWHQESSLFEAQLRKMDATYSRAMAE